MTTENLNNKKFVASYSGGKDSILAIYRAIKKGLKPLCLIITYNKEKNLSWFHGLPKGVLNSISKSLNIPIWIVETNGEKYAENFEKALLKAKKQGAEICIFGDIDLEGHLQWATKRCENIGLKPYFPLWKEDRKKLMFEFLNSGFVATFTTINKKMLDDKFIGSIITKDICQQIEKEGVDICGENGEYHTFVYDGPIFKEKVKFKFGDKIEINEYTILPVLEIC